MVNEPFSTPFPVEGDPQKAFVHLQEMGNALGPLVNKQAEYLHEELGALEFGLKQVHARIDRNLKTSLRGMEKKLNGLADKQLQCLLGMVADLQAGLDVVKQNIPEPVPEPVTPVLTEPCEDCGPAALAMEKAFPAGNNPCPKPWNGGTEFSCGYTFSNPCDVKWCQSGTCFCNSRGYV